MVVIWRVGPHDAAEVETNLQNVLDATGLDQLEASAEAQTLRFDGVYR